MADLDVSATITRTHLSLDPLQLQQPGVYELVSYAPAARTKRRTVATSPVVPGGRQTSSVADMAAVRLAVRVKGASRAALDANAAVLLAAFDQPSYTLTVAWEGGVTTAWECDDADVALADGEVNKYQLMAAVRRQVWVFTCPVQPYPTAGVF